MDDLNSVLNSGAVNAGVLLFQLLQLLNNSLHLIDIERSPVATMTLPQELAIVGLHRINIPPQGSLVDVVGGESILQKLLPDRDLL